MSTPSPVRIRSIILLDEVFVAEVEVLGVVVALYRHQLCRLAAIVADEDDNGVVGHVALPEMVEHTSDALVDVLQHSGIDGHPRYRVRILTP